MLIWSFCFCHHYFTVCALQVISFIILSIQLNIAGNSEVRAVICFEWIHFFTIRLIPYLRWVHIHTLSLTSIILILYFITFLLQILMWRCKHRKNRFDTRGCWPQWGRRTHFWKSLVSLPLRHNRNGANQYCLQPSRERDIFNNNPEISLLGSTFLMASQMGDCPQYW